MTNKIYLIPGLGFDRRIFSLLKLNAKTTHFIEYINPLKNESLQSYISRLIETNLKSTDPITLIGHSFGGIIAQEIANQISIEKIILISSIKSKKENPFHFKIISKMNLHRLFNKNWTLKIFPFWANFHGYETEAIQKLFINMISNKSDQYLQWALYQLSVWRGVDDFKTPIVHFHGDKDRTFPIRLIENPIVIKNGSHAMVYNKAKEISALINGVI